jgi:CRP-like cAMP-binding protein
MEQLLALKQVPLFVNLSLDHLEAIQRRSVEASYLPGEVIVREGDLGGELYLLLEGVVEVYLGYETPQQQEVAVLEAVDYFGEMAIFDDAPRSAAVVAREQTRVLVLDGGSFKELITEAPEISFEIFRVLTARVRAAERRGATR